MGIVAAVAATGLTLFVAACGKAPDTNTPGGTSSAAPKYTACMVTDQGGLDDKSFNASAWKGMEAARDDAGTNVEIRNVPSTTQNDYEPNLTTFVNQNCDFILAVGGLMGDAVTKVAKANPTKQFAIVDANPNVPNVFPMQFDTAQAAFLAGYLAAGYSKSGKVGTYGGLKIPPVTIFMDGFADGVAYYNTQKSKSVQVLGWNKATQSGLFSNDFASAPKGKQLSDTLFAQGADVIMPVAGGTGQGTTQDAAAGKFTYLGGRRRLCEHSVLRRPAHHRGEEHSGRRTRRRTARGQEAEPGRDGGHHRHAGQQRRLDRPVPRLRRQDRRWPQGRGRAAQGRHHQRQGEGDLGRLAGQVTRRLRPPVASDPEEGCAETRTAASPSVSVTSSPTTTSTWSWSRGRSTPCSARTGPASRR